MALIFYHGNSDLFNILLGALFAGVPAIIVLLLQELFNDYKTKKLRTGILNSVIYEIDNNEGILLNIFQLNADRLFKLRSKTFSGPLLSLVQLRNLEEHFDIFTFNNLGVEQFHFFKDRITEFTTFPPFGPNCNREIFWKDAAPIIGGLFEFKQLILLAIRRNSNFEITREDITYFINEGNRKYDLQYGDMKFEEPKK